MIYHVRGELILCETDLAVIDVGGVGYKMTVSQNTSSHIRKHVGQTTLLYTYMSVREDAVELFGFRDSDELTAFKLLITVSGVGPKAAMAVLSIMTPDQLSAAIATDNVKAISKASGVGGKTAARIVLDLKGKMAKEFPVSGEEMPTEPITSAKSENMAEALEALIVLGYRRPEATEALRGLDPAADVSSLIKAALAKLLK